MTIEQLITELDLLLSTGVDKSATVYAIDPDTQVYEVVTGIDSSRHSLQIRTDYEGIHFDP